jgi:indole-3-glycerol phosphate synthase
MGRFSQAIAEGDGISIVPVVQGEIADLAALAEEAGAEALAVGRSDAAAARAATALPVVVDGVRNPAEIESLVESGADSCVTVFDLDSGEGVLIDEIYPAVDRLGLDCAVEVRDAEALGEVLERFDPEILVAACGEGADQDELEHVLDLLADVPAGKLVVARSRRPVDREQIVGLERAGVDAILVGGDFLRVVPDFATALAELTGR